ncbi:MAG: preprotein translocase subunit SecY [Sedimentisphaerales bacterium]|nr:preprotein translocase subunit SecY [Sedimentisphaerales bacterium]
MFNTLLNIFKIPELRNKIIFTVILLCIYRVGFYVPVPGVDQGAMRELMSRGGDTSSPFGRVADFMQMFTGGSLRRSSLFGLGIMPYISASIIFQLLVTVVPALEKLHKEGEVGRKKIQEYTRYLTVGLCMVQSSAMVIWMIRSGFVYDEVVKNYYIIFFMMGVLAMTAGTIFLMWLGEQIDEYGIGNGISLIIMAGIVSRMPWAVEQVIKMANFSIDAPANDIGPAKLIFLVVAFLGVVAGAILITQGQRRIPIQQAKMTRGRRVYGGQRQYLPLRVNHGGVMPIIFAVTLMQFPSILLGWLSNAWPNSSILNTLNSSFNYNSFIYNFLYIVMIYFFAYFWTTVQFNPKEMATQLRDYGSFIPGLRPGRRTAEYLEKVMTRITYVGAAFLSLIAVVPTLVMLWLKIPFGVAQFLGGTGLLIVVSVSLDLVQRIESNLIMRNYAGFMEGGRIKGAYR